MTTITITIGIPSSSSSSLDGGSPIAGDDDAQLRWLHCERRIIKNYESQLFKTSLIKTLTSYGRHQS